METADRSGPNDLTHLERLAADPERHDLYHALRVIEAAFADAPRLGESRRPREDMVRLGQEAELAFPTSTIAAFKPSRAGKPARLVNRFFGLFGPQGPMPLHITEFVRDRLRNHRDPTLVAFADTLTHRMMGLLFRAWSTGQPAPSFDRADDPIARKVAALSGLHGEHLQDRDAMPDLAKLHFTGHVAQGSKNPEGLVAILSGFFQVPVQIEEFIGSWLQLEPDDRWQLGAPAALGQSTSIGDQVYSRAAKFRIVIGPLRMVDYERLLPGGDSLVRLKSILRGYVGDSLDWDVNLILAGQDVPRASLGGTTRLGHTSWLQPRKTDDTDRPDAADLFLHPDTTQQSARPKAEAANQKG